MVSLYGMYSNLNHPIRDSLFHLRQRNQTGLAILIDPDKHKTKNIRLILEKCRENPVHWILVGGSLISENVMEETLQEIRLQTKTPIILFPGNLLQIHPGADAMLLLSLISGRNAELLIGQHVHAAPIIKQHQIHVLPTGYMLIDGGGSPSVQYISQTLPIPHDKAMIAACTALAGEQLGLECIYMDTGSGAKHTVSVEMVRAVHREIQIPILVGGGIRTSEQAHALALAGASLLIIGTSAEQSPQSISEICDAIQNANITQAEKKIVQ